MLLMKLAQFLTEFDEILTYKTTIVKLKLSQIVGKSIME